MFLGDIAWSARGRFVPGFDSASKSWHHLSLKKGLQITFEFRLAALFKLRSVPKMSGAATVPAPRFGRPPEAGESGWQKTLVQVGRSIAMFVAVQFGESSNDATSFPLIAEQC